MMPFEFPELTTVTLTNVNPRKELHGDELRQADEPGEVESPFLNDNPAPLDRDPDDIGAGPLFPETPEDALSAAVH